MPYNFQFCFVLFWQRVGRLDDRHTWLWYWREIHQSTNINSLPSFYVNPPKRKQKQKKKRHRWFFGQRGDILEGWCILSCFNTFSTPCCERKIEKEMTHTGYYRSRFNSRSWILTINAHFWFIYLFIYLFNTFFIVLHIVMSFKTTAWGRRIDSFPSTRHWLSIHIVLACTGTLCDVL